MFNQATARRDAFTFSLGGMATISSFAFAPAIAGSQLRQVRDEQQNQKPDSWFRWHRQPA